MARKKEEEVKQGLAEWMGTFSDMMTLLMCFFVMLFSMSTIDAAKYDAVADSFQQTFSIFKAGAQAIGDGILISNGVSQLNQLDEYINSTGRVAESDSDSAELEENAKGQTSAEAAKALDEKYKELLEKMEDGKATVEDVDKLMEALAAMELADALAGIDTQKLAELLDKLEKGENSDMSIEELLEALANMQLAEAVESVDAEALKELLDKLEKGDEGMTLEELLEALAMLEQKELLAGLEADKMAMSESLAELISESVHESMMDEEIEVSFNSNFVLLTLNGAFLFDSGEATLKAEAIPVLKKIGVLLTKYADHTIEIEGHTDSVPMNGGRYQNNDVLSSYRALAVFNYLRDNTSIDPAIMKHSGRGEYLPIADNSTPEGRAKNRRVEIKIYNSLSAY